ncbi:MAG TPA: hypothetical protein VET23_04190 [Chitinophagaceae bacterium]|nr:hypothetical protein [Chitinophagaceae bacterium]
MKAFFSVVSSFIILFTLSCNNSGNNTSGKDDNKPKTKADSLMDDIMAGHDASMAKMNKLSVLKAKIQHTLDSVEGLPKKARKASAAFKAVLDSSQAKLIAAEEQMNKWMDEFNMDSLENNMAERIKYLESERSKVTKVREDLLSSLQKADSLVKKTVRQ